LLQDDWEIFSNRIVTASNWSLMQTLTVSILEAGLHPKHDVDEPDYSGLFEREEPSIEDEWHEQVAKILARTPSPVSQFPVALGEKSDWEPNRIEATIFGLAEIYPAEANFFRARIYTDLLRTKPFELDELGAPKPESVPAQRANRKSEPVLYLANNAKTALAEVRAWRGAFVAIGTFALARSLSVLNLTKISGIQSPFFVEQLAWKVNSIVLLRRFAKELSRPILRGNEEKEDFQYKPSQQACDAIRKAGYDGIAYPSAMGHGYNIVLFDPVAARPIKSVNVRVASVSHRSVNLPTSAHIGHDWPYEDVPEHKKT